MAIWMGMRGVVLELLRMYTRRPFRGRRVPNELWGMIWSQQVSKTQRTKMRRMGPL